MKSILIALLIISQPLQAAGNEAAILYYRVSEPGIEPYQTRWLITGSFLRIDEGKASDNYILFDRRGKTVYSVVHEDRTVLEIPNRAVTSKPAKALKQESRTVRDDKLPSIDGRKPSYRELYVNGALCYSTVSVDKLLPDAVKAMREYRQVMAGEHDKNMNNTPVAMQQPCELVLLIFNPIWPLNNGLPIQEWDPQGKGQSLLNYKTGDVVDSGLFKLPEGYRHYQTQGGP